MKKFALPLPNSFFRFGLLLLTFKTIAGGSIIIPYSDLADDVLSLLGAACFAVAMLQKRIPRKTLAWYGLVLCAAAYSATQIGTMMILMVVMTCIAFREEDTEKSIAYMFFWESLLLGIHTLASVILALAGISMETEISGVLRFNFGFSHPNVFTVLLVNVTCMWLWLRYDALQWRHLLVCLGLHLVFFCFTNTRTAIGVLLLICLLYAVFHHRPRYQPLLRGAAAAAFPAATVVMLVLLALYSSNIGIINRIDDLLSWRVHMGAYALERYGITLFGQDLTSVSVVWDEFWQMSGLTFDNLYSYLLVNYGVVWILAISILFCRTARHGRERDCVVLLAWCAYGMTEIHGINPYMFFPLLLACAKREDMI